MLASRTASARQAARAVIFRSLKEPTGEFNNYEAGR
jgi:hypothetical protein